MGLFSYVKRLIESKDDEYVTLYRGIGVGENIRKHSWWTSDLKAAMKYGGSILKIQIKKTEIDKLQILKIGGDKQKVIHPEALKIWTGGDVYIPDVRLMDWGVEPPKTIIHDTYYFKDGLIDYKELKGKALDKEIEAYVAARQGKAEDTIALKVLAEEQKGMNLIKRLDRDSKTWEGFQEKMLGKVDKDFQLLKKQLLKELNAMHKEFKTQAKHPANIGLSPEDLMKKQYSFLDKTRLLKALETSIEDTTGKVRNYTHKAYEQYANQAFNGLAHHYKDWLNAGQYISTAFGNIDTNSLAMLYSIPRGEVGNTKGGMTLTDADWHINHSLTTEVFASVQNMFTHGLSISDTATLIEKSTDMARYRALRAARTYSGLARNLGQFAFMQQNKEVFPKWVWVTHFGEGTCWYCESMHGTVHNADEMLNDHFNGNCEEAPLPIGLEADELLGERDIENPYTGELETIKGNPSYSEWLQGLKKPE